MNHREVYLNESGGDPYRRRVVDWTPPGPLPAVLNVLTDKQLAFYEAARLLCDLEGSRDSTLEQVEAARAAKTGAYYLMLTDEAISAPKRG